MTISRNRVFIDRYLGVIISLIVLNVVFTLSSRYYFTAYNLTNILGNSAISLILSTGMVFVLATGGIDLSVGSVLALTGVITASAMKAGVPIVLAVGIGIVIGTAIGGTNGWIISRFRLQPFIVTLAMLSIARGLTLVLSGGDPVIGMPDAFLRVFAGVRLLNNGVYIAALVALVSAITLNKSKFGRYLRGIGDSEEAVYLCGVSPSRVRIGAYAVSGGLAAFASMLFMASMDAAEPIAGLTTEWMEAIAAPIIGGNTLDGGRALMVGAVIGVLIVSTIKSGLNTVGVGQHFQQIAIGSVIIAAVIIDSLRRRGATGA